MPEITLQDAVDQINASNKTIKGELDASTKKQIEENEKLQKELKAAQDKVEEQKAEMTKMGASILDLQEFQKNFNAKNARRMLSGNESKATVEASLSKFIGENAQLIIKSETGNLLEPAQIKAVSTGSLSGTGSPYPTYLPWQPGMEPIGQFRIRTLLNTIPSDFDTVYFPRAVTPVGTAGSFSKQTSEGSTKSQVDRTWTMQTVNLYAFSGFITVSRQSLRNIPYLQAWLPTSLNEQLLDQEDLDFANQLVAGATGSSSTTGAGSVAIEQIIVLMKNLIKTKFYPNAVAVDPDKWASILITKPQNYSLPNAVVVTPTGSVNILGKPVYPANWLTGGRTLIGDFTKAAIVESEALTFRQTDSHASQFTSNQITFLLERTENLAIFRTDAFCTAILS